MRVFTRFVAVCVGTAVYLGMAAQLSAAGEKRRPDVLVILADDLGYSDLGCYGGEINTPNLDALAQSGLRFTQFYNTARCWPSRAALMTGFYAQQVRRDTLEGVANTGGKGVRPTWAHLLPEMLKTSGYRSFHSGKWHIDGTDIGTGFDRGYDLEDQSRYFSPEKQLLDGKHLPKPTENSGFYATREIANRALEFLSEHVDKTPESPFFGYIAFTSPHFPLHAEPGDIQKYQARYALGWDVLREERWKKMKEKGIINTALPPTEQEVGPPYDFPEAIKMFGPNEVNRPVSWNTLSPEQQKFQATKMSIHAAMVDRMDQEIGRIIAFLKEKNRLENTLILFLSDNGASAEMMVRGDGHDPSAEPGSAKTHLCIGPGWSSASNTPLRRHKTWVHEGGISTPFIVHWPEGIKEGGVLRHTPAHLIDVVPSVLEVAGASLPREWNGVSVPPFPGKSIVPAFQADSRVERPYLWWSHEGNNALREGDFKIVKAKGSVWELYDLSVDRGEQNNLATKDPDRLKRMAETWTKTNGSFVELLKNTP